MQVPGALNGITVIDFTQYVAGPAATRMMAEMGADVIKLELTPHGDQARQMPIVRDGRSGYFFQWNVGKRSLCVDIRHPRGADLVRRLLQRADVLVENFSPGVVGRLGFDWDTVHALNPKLVMCSISAFGQKGPLADQPGFDYIGQAYAGVTSLIGEPDEAPPLTGVAVGDVGAGISAVAAINAALLAARAPDGEGQFIDVSLVDFYFHCQSTAVQLHTASGGEIQPTRCGSQHSIVAPMGIFKGRERYVVIIPTMHMWPKLVEAMGKPELLDDPRFSHNAARLRHRDELVAEVEAWLQSQASDEEAVATLQKYRVPVAPVLSVAEAVRHPHLVGRGTVRQVSDPRIGDFSIPGMIAKMPAYGEPAGLTAPDLGEHNAEILSEKLDLDADEVAALEADGVLLCADPPARR